MADMKTRRQGHKKEVGVREKGVASLEEAFQDGPHAQYLSQHGHVHVVSSPLPFSFMHLAHHVECQTPAPVAISVCFLFFVFF